MARHSRMKCKVCNRPIRSKPHFWSGKAMCKPCFAYHTRTIIKTSNLLRKIANGGKRLQRSRPANAPTVRSWFQRIFG